MLRYTDYRIMGHSMFDRAYYHRLRGLYEPEHLKLIIVAESPPISGKYFYDKSGALSEPLLSSVLQRLKFACGTKEDGLREIQRRGIILVDATYEPVNGMSSAARDRVIERDYSILVDDLKSLSPNLSTPIILLKTNVCKLLDPKLTKDGFIVINRGRTIPFPSTGQQTKSILEFTSILEAAGISL
jgi:hypothetical protein